MRPTHDLHLDFETYCDLDLRKVGLYRYTTHPSFQVLAVAWKLDGRNTLCATAAHTLLGTRLKLDNSGTPLGARLPPDLIQALKSPDVQGHAFNAAFETAVLERLGVFVANPLSCTMQRALAYGLPGRLENAAAALGLAHQKDMIGHRLMLKMSRPPKSGVAPTAWTPSDYIILGDYCARDVDAEAALSEVIPELQPDEKELSALDARMNTEGKLGVDLPRVAALGVVAGAAEKVDAARCAVLTAGAVTSPGTQTARLLLWLGSKGLALPDTARATIEEALLLDLRAEGVTDWEAVAEVLEIRLRMARASTRKLERMTQMSEPPDHALRGQFQFCGAGRTGRWSGRGVQVQNLPRVPKGFSPDLFEQVATQACLGGPWDLNIVTPAPVLDCVSWSLRSCLKASEDDHVLWSFDFSQIEARVLAWLAGQQDVLAVFASGDDVYVWAAAQFGSSDRQLGKVLILALGFGMGAIKLRETARKAYGVVLTAGEAERFKDGWRRSNPHIVRFWHEMETAAREAILRRGSGWVAPAGGSGIAFCCTGKTLQMRLPSGRVLYYHRPRIDFETGSIVYWGPEVGNRWVEQRTWGGKLAENATQAAARDVMSEAMLRAWRRVGVVPCMTVHDELVYPIPAAGVLSKALNILRGLMLEAPPWAGGLPLAGEHKIMRRYGVAGLAAAIANQP
jgi:DNA polymerase